MAITNFFLPRKIINFINFKDCLAKGEINNHIISFKKVKEDELIILNPPKKIDHDYWGVFDLKGIALSSVYVLKVANGNYIPNHCAYVSPNNKLIDDFSIEFSTPHDKEGFARSIFKEKLPRVKKLNYNIAILDSAGSFNYFHWLLNILPKVEFFENCDFEIDYYLVDQQHKFQIESLKLLNFPVKKIINKNEFKNLKAKNLIFSNLPTSPGALNPSSLSFICDRFIKNKTTNNFTKKRIYITRRNARQGRKITNEEDLIKKLELLNFGVYELEKLSFQEQITLFSDAEIIIAPHGAGLTNMIFCNEGIKLIEILNPNFQATCYWILANLKKIDYYCIFGEGAKKNCKELYNCSEDITLNMEKMIKVLDLAGVKS